jgi:hypothetical protein
VLHSFKKVRESMNHNAKRRKTNNKTFFSHLNNHENYSVRSLKKNGVIFYPKTFDNFIYFYNEGERPETRLSMRVHSNGVHIREFSSEASHNLKGMFEKVFNAARRANIPLYFRVKSTNIVKKLGAIPKNGLLFYPTKSNRNSREYKVAHFGSNVNMKNKAATKIQKAFRESRGYQASARNAYYSYTSEAYKKWIKLFDENSSKNLNYLRPMITSLKHHYLFKTPRPVKNTEYLYSGMSRQKGDNLRRTGQITSKAPWSFSTNIRIANSFNHGGGVMRLKTSQKKFPHIVAGKLGFNTNNPREKEVTLPGGTFKIINNRGNIVNVNYMPA